VSYEPNKRIRSFRPVNRKLVILVVVVAILCASGVVAAVVALAGSRSSDMPVAAAPPDWVKSIVSDEVRWCGNPTVDSALWVLTDYASAEARLDQQSGGESRQEYYLVVLTSDKGFVGYKEFYPPGAQPPRGKYMELLINAETHLVDTFGIGNDVVETDGLGQVSSYVVN
jgi:hypothetical protein